MLLFRGADRAVLNKANQDAFQVAVISGNHDLANVIRSFDDEHIGGCDGDDDICFRFIS